MYFPVLLDMDSPKVYAYSIYSVIAEKFEAIVSLGRYNSRYKDFYDIYALSNKFILNGNELITAIIETFDHRNTNLTDIIAFSDNYINDPTIESKWKSFLRKKQVSETIDFQSVIIQNKMLLLPIVEAILNGETYRKNWDPIIKNWK